MLLDPIRHGPSRRERRLLRRLVAAGAVVPSRAHPLPTLRRAPAGWLIRLEASGLVRRGDGEGYYVDLAAYDRWRRERRRRLGAAALAILGILAGLGALLQ